MKRLLLTICMLFLWISSAWADGMVIGFPAAAGSDTISYIAYAVGNDNEGDNPCEVAKPTGTLEGHRMFAWITTDDDTTMSPPSGWTLIHTQYQSGMETWVYYKDAGAAEGASYEFTAGAAGYMVGHIVTVSKSGGTWADPTGGTLNAITGSTSNPITTSSVTATTGSILLCGFGNDGYLTVSTAPTSMTLTALAHNYADNLTSQVVYYQTSMTAGAVTKSITWSSADGMSASAVVCGLQ